MARRGAARLALLAVIVTTLVIGAAPTALAACHAFRVAVQPASVAEGGEVTVTVSRDGAVAASRIDVETIDGTALRGADYVQVARRTISFTNEVEQSFEVATVDNAEAEPSETFRLHLSNPGGCAVNTNFDVGPDAVVTITDADRAPTTSAPTPTSPPTTAAKPTTSPTAGSTTTAPGSGSTTSIEASASSSASTTTTDGGSTTTELRGEELAADEDGGGGGGPLIVGALVVLAGAGAAGWWLVRRRAAG